MTVYFAQQGERGAIKIGWTVNLDGRMAALRTSSSTVINLLAEVDGDKKTESFFHHELSDDRAFGEWFHPTPRVIEIIETVKADGINCIPVEFRAGVLQPSRIARSTADIIAEAKLWIIEIGTPHPFDEHITDRLKRVAALSGVSPRALKAIWYDKTKQLNAHVYVGLKECFEAKMASLLRGKR